MYVKSNKLNNSNLITFVPYLSGRYWITTMLFEIHAKILFQQPKSSNAYSFRVFWFSCINSWIFRQYSSMHSILPDILYPRDSCQSTQWYHIFQDHARHHRIKPIFDPETFNSVTQKSQPFRDFLVQSLKFSNIWLVQLYARAYPDIPYPRVQIKYTSIFFLL